MMSVITPIAARAKRSGWPFWSVEMTAGNQKCLVADGFGEAFVSAPVIADDTLKERCVIKGNPGRDCRH